MTYAIFQAVVITLIIAWSVWFAVRRFFPRAYRGVLAHFAERLARAPNARVRGLAAKLMPQQVASSGGCDSGGACSSCGTCAPVAEPRGEVRPLVFHSRTKS